MALPGSYDFARDAWFKGIGAVGKTLGPVTVVKPAAPQRRSTGAQALAEPYRARLPEGSAGIATAFATGDQNAVDQGDADAMRRSGLTHLLSVSGLHITAVVAFAMLLTLRLLALSETAGPALQPGPRRRSGGGGCGNRLHASDGRAGANCPELRRGAPDPRRHRPRAGCDQHSPDRHGRADRARFSSRGAGGTKLSDELWRGHRNRRAPFDRLGAAVAATARGDFHRAPRARAARDRRHRFGGRARTDADGAVPFPSVGAVRSWRQHCRHPPYDLRDHAARGGRVVVRCRRARTAALVPCRASRSASCSASPTQSHRPGCGRAVAVDAGLGVRIDDGRLIMAVPVDTRVRLRDWCRWQSVGSQRHCPRRPIC